MNFLDPNQITPMKIHKSSLLFLLFVLAGSIAYGQYTTLSGNINASRISYSSDATSASQSETSILFSLGRIQDDFSSEIGVGVLYQGESEISDNLIMVMPYLAKYRAWSENFGFVHSSGIGIGRYLESGGAAMESYKTTILSIETNLGIYFRIANRLIIGTNLASLALVNSSFENTSTTSLRLQSVMNAPLSEMNIGITLILP